MSRRGETIKKINNKVMKICIRISNGNMVVIIIFIILINNLSTCIQIKYIQLVEMKLHE